MVVNGASGNETVNLDHGGGPFGPGPTPEPSGTPEIELTANMAGGTDVLTLHRWFGSGHLRVRLDSGLRSTVMTTSI